MAFIVTTIFITMFVVGFLPISYGTTLIYLPYGVRIRILVAFVFINYAWISIFVFVSMIISSREIGILVNLALVIAIMFSSYELEHLLGQPELSDATWADECLQLQKL